MTTVESFRYLRTDLDAIGRVSYVCELLDAFSESDDENAPFWELVLTILRILDTPTRCCACGAQRPDAAPAFDRSLLLRWFELPAGRQALTQLFNVIEEASISWSTIHVEGESAPTVRKP